MRSVCRSRCSRVPALPKARRAGGGLLLRLLLMPSPPTVPAALPHSTGSPSSPNSPSTLCGASAHASRAPGRRAPCRGTMQSMETRANMGSRTSLITAAAEFCSVKTVLEQLGLPGTVSAE
jgi:hypothetical protein